MLDHIVLEATTLSRRVDCVRSNTVASTTQGCRFRSLDNVVQHLPVPRCQINDQDETARRRQLGVGAKHQIVFTAALSTP